MENYILAIDQGTTSFEQSFLMKRDNVASSKRNSQYFPHPGWVEWPKKYGHRSRFISGVTIKKHKPRNSGSWVLQSKRTTSYLGQKLVHI